MLLPSGFFRRDDNMTWIWQTFREIYFANGDALGSIKTQAGVLPFPQTAKEGYPYQ